MKKLLFFAILLCGCSSQPVSKQFVIETMCEEFASDTLTSEESAHWDSLNITQGGYLLIRGAERDLDTIVNHIHLKFRTEK